MFEVVNSDLPIDPNIKRVQGYFPPFWWRVTPPLTLIETDRRRVIRRFPGRVPGEVFYDRLVHICECDEPIVDDRLTADAKVCIKCQGGILHPNEKVFTI